MAQRYSNKAEKQQHRKIGGIISEVLADNNSSFGSLTKTTSALIVKLPKSIKWNCVVEQSCHCYAVYMKAECE